jgi:hypothetical protein
MAPLHRNCNVVSKSNYNAKILNVLIKLKGYGRTDSTLKFVSDRLKYLAKSVDLDNPESVGLFMARKKNIGAQSYGMLQIQK